MYAILSLSTAFNQGTPPSDVEAVLRHHYRHHFVPSMFVVSQPTVKKQGRVFLHRPSGYFRAVQGSTRETRKEVADIRCLAILGGALGRRTGSPTRTYTHCHLLNFTTVYGRSTRPTRQGGRLNKEVTKKKEHTQGRDTKIAPRTRLHLSSSHSSSKSAYLNYNYSTSFQWLEWPLVFKCSPQ